MLNLLSISIKAQEILKGLGVTIIGIISLIFLIMLIANNNMFDKRKSKLLMQTSGLLIVLMIVESINFIITELTVTSELVGTIMMVVRSVCYYTTYILMPLIPALLIYMVHRFKKKNGAGLIALFVINILFIIGDIVLRIVTKEGYIFTFANADGVVTPNLEMSSSKGYLFFVPGVISAIEVFILFGLTVKDFDTMKKQQRIILWSLAFVIGLTVAIQLLAPGVLILWSCVAICLMIYYLLLHIQMFKLDSLSGLLNRHEWESDMEVYNGHISCTIIMFDLNNLKKINDIRGHAAGDDAIARVARTIKLSFGHYGNCYRIGGDEFIVMTRVPSSKIEECIRKFDSFIDQQELTVAYGAIEYDHTGKNDIYQVFKIADERMYAHKKSLKKGRQD
ncbi:MAG: GGDEF domain-containing protein [Bacilli bacterium]|nr:GGDEF domain-containing protein [Bacilli bacterium]